MPVGHFLGGIGALIWSPSLERYLLLRRSDQKDFASGAWECVTGRVDQGEGFMDALQREVGEEIGVSARLVFPLGTTHFYRGAHTPENELIGVVCLCTIQDPEAVRLSEEHAELRWLSAAEAEEMLSRADPPTRWLRGVLRRAEELRQLLPEQVADYFQQNGFELG